MKETQLMYCETVLGELRCYPFGKQGAGSAHVGRRPTPAGFEISIQVDQSGPLSEFDALTIADAIKKVCNEKN